MRGNLSRALSATRASSRPFIRDRMLFAAEMGYLRGHGDGMHAAGTMFDDLRKKVIDGTE